MSFAADLAKPGLTIVEWENIGHKLTRAHAAVNWAIGDWLVYGEGRGEWGDIYARAAEITGRNAHALSQMARTSRTFPPDKRRAALSWTSHRDAIPLPDAQRERALDAAVEHRWTKRELSRHIGGLQRRRWARRGSSVMVRKHQVRCPHCAKTFAIRRKSLADAEAIEAAS
jgi:hypothetical protein